MPAPGAHPMIVITGASEGIGAAFARAYASGGRDLLLIARREGPLLQLAETLRLGARAGIHTLAQDITAPDAPAAIDRALAAAGSYCDLLVNNAGIGGSGHFDEISLEHTEQLVALNTAAPTRLMHHYLPAMRARRRGGIINLGSLAGFTPGPYQAAYSASRAYMLTLSAAVAAEVAQDGVRITAVAPGPVDTRFHEKIGADGDYYRVLLPGLSPAAVARWAITAHNLGVRVIVPGFVNNVLALFLRLLPYRVTVQIQGWLFYPRNR